MPIAKTYKASEVSDDLCDGCFKFVKVSGEYRFAGVHTDHNTMVEKHEEPLVEAAGLFSINGEDLSRGNNYSMTLKKGCKDEHFDEIAKLLGRKVLQRRLL